MCSTEPSRTRGSLIADPEVVALHEIARSDSLLATYSRPFNKSGLQARFTRIGKCVLSQRWAAHQAHTPDSGGAPPFAPRRPGLLISSTYTVPQASVEARSISRFKSPT